MAGRFSRSLDLAKASWSVVRADKELLLLPVMSVAALLVIFGSFVVPFAALGGFRPGAGTVDPGTGSTLVALAFYVVAYFITLFFNTALVGAAMIRMDGGNPRLVTACASHGSARAASSATPASQPPWDCCCARWRSASAGRAGS